MANIDDLIVTQNQISDAIEAAYINFKKDGPDRKTDEYIKRKVINLDKLWEEYNKNHETLSLSENKSHSYFIKNRYEQVGSRYLSIRDAIANYQPPPSKLNPPTFVSKSDNPNQDQTPRQQQPGTSSGLGDKATASRTEDMLRKQSSNFKAFMRTAQSIKVESVSEKWEFEDLLRTLQSRWSAIDALHWELDSELDGSNQKYENQFSEYEEYYNTIKKSINKKMWSASHREQVTPKMEIPTFDGSFNNWLSFKDLFSETIHENPNLSSAQKMQFLKGKVKGEAERLIQHLHISSDNYTTCWDILNHRFNNKKKIFTSHMNILLGISVSNYQSANHIKRIYDLSNECLNAIKNIGADIKSWDPILVHLLSQKLDSETYYEYTESMKQPRELPNLKEFLDFLESKFTSLESSSRKQESIRSNVQGQQANASGSGGHYQKNHHFKQSFSSNNIIIPTKSNNTIPTKSACPLCKNNHGIFFCKQFLEMTPVTRRQVVNKYNLCNNCLYDHYGKQCLSDKRCRECNGYHNTMLHDANVKSTNNITYQASTSKSNVPTINEHAKQIKSNSHVMQQRDIPEVLLATACIKVRASDGTYYTMRALLDQGSQSSLITERAAQLLQLPRKKCNGTITGVGAKENICKGMTNIYCVSNKGTFTFVADVFIMNNVTKNLPNYTFAQPSWSYLENIELADPEFYISRPIDILFGADIYANIILEGICRSDQATPVAQQTRLGWILCGSVSTTLQCNIVINNIEEIQRFWEVEDITDSSNLSLEDAVCMEFYKETTKRGEDGRYKVKLPLISNWKEELGQSKATAVAQFKNLEKRLSKQHNLSVQYKAFLDEYSELGHMMPTFQDKTHDYYLPHHCVLKNESSTTALRVVFNASSKTSSGKSLNDIMYRGPNLQTDLQELILKWRKFKVAYTADIEKMFRQIWVSEEDQALQKIVWRDHPSKSIINYQLCTVTYGTKSAPYLAMMTLRQLAADERIHFPGASKVLEESFYMDDLLYGADTVESAIKMQKDLIALLKSAGFNLRKWASNYQDLLQNNQYHEQTSYQFKETETTKTLGLRWDPVSDHFKFQSKIDINKSKNTKRSLLSDVSKIFDPLGWLAPITTKLKILFQSVWVENIRWDDELPDFINKEWNKIKTELNEINNFTVPRWLGTEQQKQIELHGFCDSSNRAFACVIYCKISNVNNVSITLVAGKSRLVPQNKNITVPRLELNGALLLSKLMNKVEQCATNCKIIKVGWIDSTAVLGWLQGDPGKWSTFVGRRVQEITKTLPADSWRYIKSAENPADCASRGLTPYQLKNHDLWWKGPSWLPTYQLKTNIPTYHTNEEQKLSKHVLSSTLHSQYSVINDVILRCGSFTKAVHVLAWIRRVLSCKQNKQKASKYLSLSEIKQAKLIIIKNVQSESFYEDIRSLSVSNKINNKSNLSNLNPFVDKEGVLRVGGRIQHANICPEMKNPIILPNNHRLSELIIYHAHKLTSHGGVRLTLSFIRQRYWILSGNRTVKKYLRLCITCRKQKPHQQYQLMGDLPKSRSNPSRPFEQVGVDYTGYFYIKSSKGRGIKGTKGYVAVFVCMATKAVHLELVSDLTSASFMAAFRRMVARKGTPKQVHSDNGTNFVKSNRLLQEEYQEFQKIFDNQFMTEISDMEIKWNFQAPSWPSAGGLWEAAVKSLKYHLKRILNNQMLTFEEFSTVLCQVEAILNSRPLCSISDDPDDINYLTPAHFLVGGPSLTLLETESDLRTRWHYTQKIVQDLWKRWRTEYLSQLNSRCKWTKQQKNMAINDVVLVNDDNLPPGKWTMGRVVETHPGKDGLVRVVSLKTKGGLIKRPIIKLSPLPIKDKLSEYQESSNANQSQNNQPKKHSTGNIKKRFNLQTLFTALLFFMTIISNNAINITSFQESQNLYFDKLSDMQQIREEWKIVAYYDTEPYWQGVKSLNKSIRSLEILCNNIEGLSKCDALLLQLRHGFSELDYYNKLLLDQHFKVHARRRRGLINGIGYAANALFGVLDDRFSEQYQKDIEAIRMNEKHISQLWRNQTSVIEAEFNIMKRSEITMKKQHEIVQQHIKNLEKAVIQMNTEVLKHIQITNEFMMGIFISSSLLNHLKSIQSKILDTITNIYHGRFDYSMITPGQLTAELSLIASQLPNDISLPVQNVHTDLSKIYGLLEVKTRLLEKYLLLEIALPLIGREKYEIFQIISIPHVVENSNFSARISPISEYVAMNLKKDTFIPMTKDEINTCLFINEYLCRNQKAIYHLYDDKSLCETISASECKITKGQCKNMFLPSSTYNKFFYFCCRQCNIRVFCDDHVTNKQLIKAGIIHMNDNCIIKTNELTIQPHKYLSNDIKVVPDIYVPDMAPINYIMNLTMPKDWQNYTEDVDTENQWKKVEKMIEKIKGSSDDFEVNMSQHHIHHYSVIYIILGIGILSVSMYLWRRYNSNLRRTRSETQQSVIGDSNFPAGNSPAVQSPAHQLRPCVSEPVMCNHNISVQGIEMCELKSNNELSKTRKDTASSPIINKIRYEHLSQ